MSFCSKCGKETSEDAEFCDSCGASLSNDSQVTTNINQPTQDDKNQPTQDEPKEWLVTLLLCFFLGVLGVHRFYTGHTKIGVAQVLTLGGCGIWALIDFIMILVGNFKDAQGRPLKK
ncbi:uncharacterized protein METZ01_LOCUS252803 [marine metagenome]|uniref:TM2 domain-containing protein n=1 Tax=marine metagenome TaxID=408172 RepID=A0A382IKY6_9ZZZZ